MMKENQAPLFQTVYAFFTLMAAYFIVVVMGESFHQGLTILSLFECKKK